MSKNKKNQMSSTEVTVQSKQHEDYISLTDLAFEFASWVSVEFKLSDDASCQL